MAIILYASGTASIHVSESASEIMEYINAEAEECSSDRPYFLAITDANDHRHYLDIWGIDSIS